MRLVMLQCHGIRNLLPVVIEPHAQFNIFLGENGSGKTSLLEAIHLLALGRSFRSRHIQTVINYQQQALTCFGQVLENDTKTTLGIEKTKEGETHCKIDGSPCRQLSAFASLLPVQLLTPDTFKLLTAGPEERRRFMDWGVFHVEHSFAQLCQRYQRLLKQRNAALKARAGMENDIWGKELAYIGEKIHQHRQHYLGQFLPFWQSLQHQWLHHLPLTFNYEPGWNSELTLEEALCKASSLDQRWGYTTVGPHRAELMINLAHFPAHQLLSRGQQKSLVCCLHLAQGQHLAASLHKKCLYLIDDFAAEFDVNNQEKLLSLLAQQNHQVFLTTTEQHVAQKVLQYGEGRIFDIEQQQVTLLA